MKRFLSVIVLLLFLLSLSIPVFSASLPSAHQWIENINGEDVTVFGNLNVSAFYKGDALLKFLSMVDVSNENTIIWYSPKLQTFFFEEVFPGTEFVSISRGTGPNGSYTSLNFSIEKTGNTAWYYSAGLKYFSASDSFKPSSSSLNPSLSSGSPRIVILDDGYVIPTPLSKKLVSTLPGFSSAEFDFVSLSTDMYTFFVNNEYVNVPASSPVVRNLTIYYQYEDGSTAAPAYTDTLKSGESYNVSSPIIGGYTASFPIISGQIEDADATYTVTYTKNPVLYNLIIHYQYEGGSTAAPAYTDTLKSGESYSVSSPIIGGYTASFPIVSGQIEDADATYTVTYTKNPVLYDLTVHYQYEDGSTAAPSHTESLENNAAFSINSPIIDGYTASAAVVSGKIVDSDSVYTVTYTKNATLFYDLTIHYRYEDETQAAPSYTARLADSEAFSVSSPYVASFSPVQSNISGTIAGADVSYTVYYTPIGVIEPPGKNVYIPWNTALFGKGAASLLSSAGTAINVGLWIFLIVTGIFLTIKTINSLAR